MKELQIKETKIDWLKIIKLALNKKDWGKSYTLYVYGDVSIKAEIESFHFPSNKARFRITVVTEKETFSSWDSYSYVEYYLSNFTIKDFEPLVIRKIMSRLNDMLRIELRRKAEDEYEELYHDTDYIYNNQKVLEEYNMWEDYQNAENLSESLCETVQNEIIEGVLSELNEEYEDNIRDYISQGLKSGEGIKTINLFNLYNNIKDNFEKVKEE